jgi:hypothetical protein
MRRWDSLTDAYIEENEARGINPATIENAHRELSGANSYFGHCIFGGSSWIRRCVGWLGVTCGTFEPCCMKRFFAGVS